MALFVPIGSVNSIASNVAASSTARVLTESTFLLQKSLARLSSGLRIITAGDDPSGAAASVKMEAELSRLSAAQTNVTNAQSYVDTQSGFLSTVQTAVDRMGELATLASDDLTTTSERAEYQEEFSELQDFVSSVGKKNFNGVSVFSGSNFNVTIDSDGGTFTLDTLKYHSTGFFGGLSSVYNSATLDISTTAAAASAVTDLTTAEDNVGLMLAKAGAHSERLTLTSEGLSVHSENLTNMDNSVVKTDTAAEAVRFATYSLLADAGTAMLVQANLVPLKLLDLLKFDRQQ